MKARRLAWMAAAFVAVGCADVVGPSAATDHASLFDDLWHQFDLHYSYFTVTRVNWDSLGAYYRPIAASAPNDVQFARVLGAMLAELKDMHVSLSAGPAGTMRYISRFDTTATYFSDVATLASPRPLRAATFSTVSRATRSDMRASPPSTAATGRARWTTRSAACRACAR